MNPPPFPPPGPPIVPIGAKGNQLRWSEDTTGQGDLAMPPNEECPNCHQKVSDWHVEWYTSEGPSLYKGLVAMDCPLCGEPVGFRQGKIGPASPGTPVVRRHIDQVARWAASQALAAGATLQGYTSTAGAGAQYAGYWTAQEIQQADADEQSQQRP